MIDIDSKVTSLTVSSVEVEVSPGHGAAAKVTYWIQTGLEEGALGHGPCEFVFYAGQPKWKASGEALLGLLAAIENDFANAMGAPVQKVTSELPEGLVTKGI